MSPRSREFLEGAGRRLPAARAALDAGDPAAAVSLAYYVVFYAARAALSERDLYSRSHAGTWQLLYEEFVTPGSLDKDVTAAAQALQRPREQADYEAWAASREEAEEALAVAERFLAAVGELLETR